MFLRTLRNARFLALLKALITGNPKCNSKAKYSDDESFPALYRKRFLNTFFILGGMNNVAFSDIEISYL
jgi:hypothetical protein